MLKIVILVPDDDALFLCGGLRQLEGGFCDGIHMTATKDRTIGHQSMKNKRSQRNMKSLRTVCSRGVGLLLTVFVSDPHLLCVKVERLVGVYG